MAGEPLIEELSLDISPALDALEPLGAAFDDIVTGFSTSLATALSSAVGAPIDTADIVDSASITTAIDTAVGDAAPDPVPVDGDTAALDASITSATDVTPSVAVDGDTGSLTSAIDDAAAAPATVTVDADTTAAQAGISDLQATPVVVPVEADTTDAISAVDDLGNAADAAIGSGGGGGAGGGGGTGLAGLESAAQGIGAATGLASGETEGLTGAVAALSPALGTAVAGGAGFVAFIGDTVRLAADAQAQNRAFTATFGDMATAVSQVDIGGLNLSFAELGKESGTAVTSIEAAATRIGLLGQSAGASNSTIKTTTDTIIAMGAAFSVTNPSLGDAAQVSDTLTNALARGGRTVAQFGLSISASQINLRALSDTGKTSAADLTQFEKVTAGAEIAAAQLGDTLGTKFASGAQNASVQLRVLKNDVQESLATIGTPLLAPAISSLQDFIPVALEVGTVLGNAAQIILPFFAAVAPAAESVVGPLKLFSDGLGFVASGVADLPEPVLIGIATGIVAIGVAMGAADGAIVALGGALTFLTATPLGLAITGIAVLGAAVDAFGTSSSHQTQVTKDFGDALFGTGSGAASLSGQVAALTPNVDKLSLAFINTFSAGTEIRSVLDNIGSGADGLTAALLGNDAGWKTYVSNVSDASFAGGANLYSVLALTKGLDEQRTALQSSEQQQIQNQLSTGQVTQAQLDAAAATVKAKEGYVDLGAVLTIVAGEADATSSALLKTNVDTGAIADAVNSFNPVKDSAAAFEAQLVSLGVVSTDAKALSKDLTAATDQQADSFKLASPAAQALAEQFGAGTITGADFEKQLFSMGVTLPNIKTELQAVQSGVDSFVSSAAKLAPSIGSALTDAEKNQSAAQSNLDSALKSQQSATDAFAAAQESGLAKIAAAQEKGGKSEAAAVKSAQDSLTTTLDASKAKIDKATTNVANANAFLVAAANPQDVISALQKGLSDITNFETNLNKVVAAGGIELAQSLASQGPQVAGAHAAAFAQDPKGVKISEALISKTDSAKQAYTGWLQTTFGPDVAQQVETQSGIVGKAFNPPLAAQVTTQLAATETAIRGAAPAIGDASGLIANRATFNFANGVDFHTVTETSIQKAQDKIRAGASGLGTAATDTGTSTTGAYGGALGVDKATTVAFQGGVAAIQAEQSALVSSSQIVGNIVGISFDLGIAAGIYAGAGNIATAASSAATSAKTGANAVIRPGSPSRLGIEIGQNFVEGIVVGISEVAPIVAVSGVLAEDMATSFSDVGVAALGGLIQGLNDPATIDAASKALSAQLAAAIAAAQTTAQTAAPTAAAQSLSSFVSAAVGQLPTASAAISKFSQNAASDLTTAQNATKALQAAQAKLAADTAQGANTAQNTAAEANAAQAKAFSTQATLNLHAAENDLARDRATKASKGTISADELLIVQVRDASTAAALKLADADKFLAAVRKTDASSTTLASDAKTVAADKANLTNAQNQLDAATNPDTFTKNLNNSTNAARAFQSDIAKLAAEGDKGLAEKLATAGPDVAGKLADSFAASSVKAKAAESAIDGASAFADSYQQFLEKQFAPAVTAQATTIGAAVGKAISAAATSTLTPLHPAALATPTLTPGQLTNPIPVTPVNLTSAPINIDLTINHSDGTITKVPIVIPASPPSKLIQKVVAEVSAG